MFTNDKRQEERTGRYGTPRLQYLQELVTQFQNSTNQETKERLVANLANFAYDLYSYMFLRQLNVLELFADCIIEPNEKLVEFGIGGVCNSCADPQNAAIITQCGGIPLGVQCLSSLVKKNTISPVTLARMITISSGILQRMIRWLEDILTQTRRRGLRRRKR